MLTPWRELRPGNVSWTAPPTAGSRRTSLKIAQSGKDDQSRREADRWRLAERGQEVEGGTAGRRQDCGALELTAIPLVQRGLGCRFVVCDIVSRTKTLHRKQRAPGWHPGGADRQRGAPVWFFFFPGTLLWSESRVCNQGSLIHKTSVTCDGVTRLRSHSARHFVLPAPSGTEDQLPPPSAHWIAEKVPRPPSLSFSFMSSPRAVIVGGEPARVPPPRIHRRPS